MSITADLLPGVPPVESPLFDLSVDDMGLSAVERDIALQLNRRGYAVLDFPDPQISERIERIKADLGPKFDFDFWRSSGRAANIGLRIQDAWQYHEDVRAIATNEPILALLGKLYGRRAFAFQTLNFPVGTQQHYHSDAIHFSSIPERFMCGVWLAMEDIHPDAGPLVYYPGSHKWPIIYNDMIGRRVGAVRDRAAQEPYERVWEAMVEASGVEPDHFCARKGQALIWAANLMHGGSAHNNSELTRWSQVTHYYFENCTYYTPAFSDPMLGNLDLRKMRDLESGVYMPNMYVDKPIAELLGSEPISASKNSVLPSDFDADIYYDLHPDVRASGVQAETHYTIYGRRENRPYKR